MYVVGLEEMVDLTATTVVLEAQSQKRAGVRFLFLIFLQNPYLLQIHVVTFRILFLLFEFENF